MQKQTEGFITTYNEDLSHGDNAGEFGEFWTTEKGAQQRVDELNNIFETNKFKVKKATLTI